MTGGRIAERHPAAGRGPVPAAAGRRDLPSRPSDVPRPGQVGLQAVADTAVVSGGPESLLQLSADPALRDRRHRADRRQPPRARHARRCRCVGDGLRRADTRFGLVNANTSYTYTARRTEPHREPAGPGRASRGRSCRRRAPAHQTTAVLRGAALGDRLQQRQLAVPPAAVRPGERLRRQPGHRLGGGQRRARRTGSGCGSASPAPTRHPAVASAHPAAAATGCGPRRRSVRVETEQGSADSPLQPTASPQTVKAPAGQAELAEDHDPRLGRSATGRTRRRGLLRDRPPRRPGHPAAAAADRRGATPTPRPRSSRCTAAADPAGLSPSRHGGGPAPPLRHRPRRGRTR